MEEEKKNGHKNAAVRLDKEFNGKVVEVISGDTLQIENTKTHQALRYILCNTKAPFSGSQSKAAAPYGFEAKDFLRSKLIGQNVKVIFEYEKLITVTKESLDHDIKEEELTLRFATVFIDNINIAAEQLKKGLTTYTEGRNEEEDTKFMEELIGASQEGIKKKQGIHSTKKYVATNWNDASQQSMGVTQKKEVFEYLKESKKALTGVVELAINGSKFKVRLNTHSVKIMLLCEGIKCIPHNDKNKAQSLWSNNALQYSKTNLVQRDVGIVLNSMDKKGVFYGSITLKGVDYAKELLEKGLAVVFGKYINHSYEISQQTAQQSQKGLWSEKNLDLSSIKELQSFTQQSKKQEITFTNIEKKVSLSEYVNPDEFYGQDNTNKQLDKIDDEMAKFDHKQYKSLQQYRAGQLIVAKFSQDKLYYRGKVVHKPGKNDEKTKVQFIDYGFYDHVYIDTIVKMPESLASIDPQCYRLNLAFLEVPTSEQPTIYNKCYNTMNSNLGDSIKIRIAYKENNINYVFVYLNKSNSVQDSVNVLLLQKGLAKLDSTMDLPKEYQFLEKIQDEAQKKEIGWWEYSN